MKEEIRKKMIEQLSKFPTSDRNKEQTLILDKLLTYISLNQIKKIGLFWGRIPEIETGPMIDVLQDLGLEIYLVRMEKERQLSFKYFTDKSQLEISKFGVYQPKADLDSLDPNQLDLLVVPGLAFNLDGYRIGFGGGYYDRLLSKYPRIQTLSLSFSIQLLANDLWLPDYYDIPVDCLITLNQILEVKDEIK